MKRIIALLLILSMLFSFAGCGDDNGDSTGTETDKKVETDVETSSETETDVPEDTLADEPIIPEFTVSENPVAYFSVTKGSALGDIYYMTVYTDESGEIYVEYCSEEYKKVGTTLPEIMHVLTNETEKSKAAELNGQSLYEEGDLFASFYIQYADNSFLTADYSGNIPEEFNELYNSFDELFKIITAHLPVYIPAPILVGEVNEKVLSEMTDILNKSGMEPLDSLMISEIAKDDYFAYSLGLSSDQGIISGVSCSPIMLASAYSFVIVTIDETADKTAISSDFENNLDWNKWVCVSASDAFIAEKGDMILCFMSNDPVAENTAKAAADSGWTITKQLENPNM